MTETEWTWTSFAILCIFFLFRHWSHCIGGSLRFHILKSINANQKFTCLLLFLKASNFSKPASPSLFPAIVILHSVLELRPSHSHHHPQTCTPPQIMNLLLAGNSQRRLAHTNLSFSGNLLGQHTPTLCSHIVRQIKMTDIPFLREPKNGASGLHITSVLQPTLKNRPQFLFWSLCST